MIIDPPAGGAVPNVSLNAGFVYGWHTLFYGVILFIPVNRNSITAEAGYESIVKNQKELSIKKISSWFFLHF